MTIRSRRLWSRRGDTATTTADVVLYTAPAGKTVIVKMVAVQSRVTTFPHSMSLIVVNPGETAVAIKAVAFSAAPTGWDWVGTYIVLTAGAQLRMRIPEWTSGTHHQSVGYGVVLEGVAAP